MINICKQCKNRGDLNWCSNCNGSPELVDNFKQKEPPSLKNVVVESGYVFGTNLNKDGKRKSKGEL